PAREAARPRVPRACVGGLPLPHTTTEHRRAAALPHRASGRRSRPPRGGHGTPCHSAEARLFSCGGRRRRVRCQRASPEPHDAHVDWLRTQTVWPRRPVPGSAEGDGARARPLRRGAGIRDWIFRSGPPHPGHDATGGRHTRPRGVALGGRFLQDPLRRSSLKSSIGGPKARRTLGVVVGLAVWVLVVSVAGLVMRETWPSYARVADAMTFTLPMMMARLAIGAGATLAMGLATAVVSR